MLVNVTEKHFCICVIQPACWVCISGFIGETYWLCLHHPAITRSASPRGFIQPKICETQRGLYCVNRFYWSGIFVMPPPITSSEGGGALPHQETFVHWKTKVLRLGRLSSWNNWNYNWYDLDALFYWRDIFAIAPPSYYWFSKRLNRFLTKQAGGCARWSNAKESLCPGRSSNGSIVLYCIVYISPLLFPAITSSVSPQSFHSTQNSAAIIFCIICFIGEAYSSWLHPVKTSSGGGKTGFWPENDSVAGKICHGKITVISVL